MDLDSIARRRVLAAGGLSLTGLAGCLGGPGDGGPGEDPQFGDGDGYPPKSATTDTPTERSVDASSFHELDVDGQTVRSIPLDVARYWHARREARFMDARGETAYDRSHILGAVWSPAETGDRELDRSGEPFKDWPKDDRVVCYCGCPHHLSALRAAELQREGWRTVYVIHEGFWAWHDAGYPMAGTEVTEQPALHVVDGVADAAHAGESAWAWHEPTGQREAALIGEDGSYALHLRFSDVTRDSTIAVETPGYRVEDSLAALTAGVVRAPDA